MSVPHMPGYDKQLGSDFARDICAPFPKHKLCPSNHTVPALKASSPEKPWNAAQTIKPDHS